MPSLQAQVLVSVKPLQNNLLSKVIKRKIDKNNSEEQVKNIIREANEKLLEQDEVKETNDGINQNLASIRHRQDQKISLNITQNKVIPFKFVEDYKLLYSVKSPAKDVHEKRTNSIESKRSNK